jgi:RNase P subunit RPR2
MNLMRRDNPSLPEDYYVNSFISGLTDYIQAHLQCHKPEDMQSAIWLARRMEMAAPKKTYNNTPYTARRQVHFESVKPVNTSPASVIQEAVQKNLCYKCREPWFPGHKKVCKMSQKAQIQALQADETDYVYITEDTDSEEETDLKKVELQLSMHALNGKKTKRHTFTLAINIGGHIANALVDTGSTTTFMTPTFAAATSCSLIPSKKMQVTVANGAILWTEFTCYNCEYNIQGAQFQSDFRILHLKGYDIILGADWVYEQSPVTLDYKKMTLKVTTSEGTEVTFNDDSLPTVSSIPDSYHLHRLLLDSVCGAVLFIKPVQQEQKQPIPQSPQIQQLLKDYSALFSEPKTLPPQRDCDHSIPLIPGAKVVNQRPYRLPHHQKTAMETICTDLIQKGIIRDSSSPYSSLVILIKKKDHTWRKCVDFRKLNFQTIKNKYPIPIIEDLLDELHGANYFSKIDLRSGYHQIRMKEEDISKTAFTTHQGHYEYVVMPFGLTNAPATFQQLMNSVLATVLRKFALVFFDDILIYSKSLPEHVTHLEQVFHLLQKNRLYAKMEKCTFAQQQVEYLGHIITQAGVATDPQKIQAILQWPAPENITQLRSFLGLTGYYRRFVKHYGLICKPLFDSLKKDNFQWKEEQANAFQKLKEAMTTSLVLALPNFSLPFMLEADASDYGIGAVLMQKGQPISFLSKSIGPRSAGLSTYDKEAMAIIEALKKWKHYFSASSLIIKTDQQSLKYIQDQKLTEGIQHKLLVKLLGYNYTVEYKKGKENKVADALSRVKHRVLSMFSSSAIPVWITEVIQSYKEDTKCQELMQQLIVESAWNPHVWFW